MSATTRRNTSQVLNGRSGWTAASTPMTASISAGGNRVSPSACRFSISRYPVGPPQYCGDVAPRPPIPTGVSSPFALGCLNDAQFPRPLVHRLERLQQRFVPMQP
jgi:hypothetical protein